MNNPQNPVVFCVVFVPPPPPPPPTGVIFQEINVVYDFSHSQSQDPLCNGDSF